MGLNVQNFTGFSIMGEFPRNNNYRNTLPIISKSGISYNLQSVQKKPSNLPIIDITIMGEYQDVLNYEYETAYSCGAEITYVGTVSARFGYYHQTIYNYNNTANKNKIKAFTYGLSIDIPAKLYPGLLIDIQVKYTQLPQPSFVKGSSYKDLNLLMLR